MECSCKSHKRGEGFEIRINPTHSARLTNSYDAARTSSQRGTAFPSAGRSWDKRCSTSLPFPAPPGSFACAVCASSTAARRRRQEASELEHLSTDSLRPLPEEEEKKEEEGRTRRRSTASLAARVAGWKQRRDRMGYVFRRSGWVGFGCGCTFPSGGKRRDRSATLLPPLVFVSRSPTTATATTKTKEQTLAHRYQLRDLLTPSNIL